jgi:wobble nucleotide-excising tRNase
LPLQPTPKSGAAEQPVISKHKINHHQIKELKMADNSNAPNHDERIKKLEKQVSELEKDMATANIMIKKLTPVKPRGSNRRPGGR